MRRFLTIAASFTTLIMFTGCHDEGGPAPAGDARSKPLVVIGIDGATWDVIDPMIAGGQLPNFARLKAQGAWGPLITVGPQTSPAVWTSIATGQFGRRHGILDFVYPYRPGPKRPVQSTERQVPALWNLLSDAGKNVCVVGYFVTYPAEKVNGVIVSYNSPQKQPGADFPADAMAPIRGDLDRIYAQDKSALWARFFPWDFDPENPPAEDDPGAEAFRLVSDRVENRILHAEYNRRAALYLAESPFDVFISYFGLVDIASHSLWKFYDDSDFAFKANPDTKRLLGEVLPEAYRYVDEFIGDLLSRMPPDSNIVIVSDHGFGSATGIFRVKESNRDLLSGNHRPNGIFLASGPDIRRGRIDGLTIIDVFPTLAYLSGLPVADDLPGDLDLRLFTEERLTARPPSYVTEYDSPPPAPEQTARAGLQAQQENIKSLQGLGYVGESFELGDADSGVFDFWASDDQFVIQHLMGELSFYLLKGDDSSARALVDEARRHDPSVPVKLLARTKQALRTIRNTIGETAVPQSAFVFIHSLDAGEGGTRGKRQAGAGP